MFCVTLFASAEPTAKIVTSFAAADTIEAPAVSDGAYVYAVSYDGRVYKLHHRSLREVWRFQTGYHVSAKVVKSGSLLFVGSGDGYVYALNDADGKEVWRYKTGDMVTRAGVLYREVVLFGGADGYLYALDQKQGQVKWRIDLGASVCADLLRMEDMLFVSTIENKLLVIDLEKREIRYAVRLPHRLSATPIYRNGKLYGADQGGSIFALDVEKGVFVWQIQTLLGTLEDPVLSDDTLWVSSMDHTLYAVDTVSGKIVRERMFRDALGAIGAVESLIAVGLRSAEVRFLDAHMQTKASVRLKGEATAMRRCGDTLCVSDSEGYLYRIETIFEEETPPQVLTPPSPISLENPSQPVSHDEGCIVSEEGFEWLLKRASISYEKRDARRYVIRDGDFQGVLTLDLCSEKGCSIARFVSYLKVKGASRKMRLQFANDYNEWGRFVRFGVDDRAGVKLSAELELCESLRPKDVSYFIMIYRSVYDKAKQDRRGGK